MAFVVRFCNSDVCGEQSDLRYEACACSQNYYFLLPPRPWNRLDLTRYRLWYWKHWQRVERRRRCPWCWNSACLCRHSCPWFWTSVWFDVSIHGSEVQCVLVMSLSMVLRGVQWVVVLVPLLHQCVSVLLWRSHAKHNYFEDKVTQKLCCKPLLELCFCVYT